MFAKKEKTNNFLKVLIVNGLEKRITKIKCPTQEQRRCLLENSLQGWEHYVGKNCINSEVSKLFRPQFDQVVEIT